MEIFQSPDRNVYRKISLGLFLILVFSFVSISLQLYKVDTEEFRNAARRGESQNLKNSRGLEILYGTVFPSSDFGYFDGSHVLLNDKGEIVSVLKSADDKLELVVGMKVEVEGRMKDSLNSDFQLMDVKSVNIK